MKFKILMIVMLAVFFQINITAQITPVKQKLFTLQSGESIFYDENNNALCTDGIKTKISTKIENGSDINYFTYENGIKKGPSKVKPPLMDCGEKNRFDCNAEQLTDGNKILFSGNTFDFNGKTYGPYEKIIGLISDDNNSKCFAFVEEKGKNFIIGIDGKKMRIDQFVLEFKISQNGERYLIVTGNKGPGIFYVPKMEDQQTTIDHKLNDKMNEMVNKMQEMQKKLSPEDFVQWITDHQAEFTSIQQQMIQGLPQQPAPPDTFYIYSNNGIKTGPFKNLKNYFISTEGGHLIVFADDKKLSDGNDINLKVNEYFDKCKFMVSSDGKKFAYQDYDKLITSGGHEYTNPLEIKYINSNLIWLSIENNEVYLYKLPF